VSNRGKNKEHERLCLELFKEAYPDFPEGKILADENQEKPDIIVLTLNGKIGIEITAIIDKKQKRAESECEKAVIEARKIYEELGLPKLQVSVHIGSEESINKKTRKQFAKAVAKLVANNIPLGSSHVTLENKWNDLVNFPYEINAILILQHPSLSINHWHVPSGGFCREDFAGELQGVLDEKETKIQGYAPDCTEQWLVVVAENMSASTFFDPSAKTINHLYKSSFDKVFLLELFKAKLFELKLI
jgi:hypothetical protein